MLARIRTFLLGTPLVLPPAVPPHFATEVNKSIGFLMSATRRATCPRERERIKRLLAHMNAARTTLTLGYEAMAVQLVRQGLAEYRAPATPLTIA